MTVNELMTNTNFKHWKSSNPDIIRLQHYQALINLISNFAIIRYSILLTDQESLMLVIDNFFLIGSTRRTRRRPVQIDNLLIEFQDGRKHLEFRGTGEYLPIQMFNTSIQIILLTCLFKDLPTFRMLYAKMPKEQTPNQV